MAEAGSAEDDVQGALKESWELFSNDFVLWILAGLILTFGTMFSLGLLYGPLTVGFVQIVEKRRNGEAATAGDIFGGFSQFGASFLAMILLFVGVFIGSLILFLPGLIFAFVMWFCFHAIAIDDLDAIGSMKRSFELVKDNPGLAVVFFIIAMVLGMAGGMVFVGGILTMPFTMILMTLAYHRMAANSAAA